MIGFYLYGAVASFGVSLYRTLRSFATSQSTRAQNLALIGMKYDPCTGTFVAGRKRAWRRWASFLFVNLVIEPLLSWLSVAVFVWSLFTFWVNRVPVPERMKELQFLIGGSRQSKDNMRKLAGELATFYNLPPPDFDFDGNVLGDDEASERDELDLRSPEWTVEVRLDRAKKRYHFRSHPEDYEGIYKAVYEYRLEGTRVLQRLIDEQSDAIGQDRQHSVRDNVIQEVEIRKRFSERSSTILTVDERLEELRNLVEWHELPVGKLKFFILHRHPETLPMQECRKYFEQELQRIQSGGDAVMKKAREVGLNPTIKDGGIEFEHPDGVSGPALEQFYNSVQCEMIVANWGVTYFELHNMPELVSYLKQLLGRESAKVLGARG